MLRHAARRIATSARAAGGPQEAFVPGRNAAPSQAAAGAGPAATPHTPPPALPPAHFVGFKKAPFKPAEWFPREQWVGLGLVASGVGYGLWRWSQAPPPAEDGSASWERGPA